MDVKPSDVAKLAEKLIEAFAYERLHDGEFARYWPLAGCFEQFCQHVKGPLEEAFANAFRAALEKRLIIGADESNHPDAWVIRDIWPPAPPRPRRKR